MNQKNSHKYDDIIMLEHPTSKRHPRMSGIERAAQFSPFAALTGYDDAIRETARYTDRRKELGEDERVILNRKLQIVQSMSGTDTIFKFTYFVPDLRKNGGTYISYEGSVRAMDEVNGLIAVKDQTTIDIAQLIEIESSVFQKFSL